MTASSTARKVNCRVAGWFICYPCPRKSNKLIAALGQVQCIRRRLAIRARTPYGTACGRRHRKRAPAGGDFPGHPRRDCISFFATRLQPGHGDDTGCSALPAIGRAEGRKREGEVGRFTVDRRRYTKHKK